MSAREKLGQGSALASGALASVQGALAARSPRERLLLGGLALVAAGALFMNGVWRPLAAARAGALDEIARIDRVMAEASAAGPRAVAPADARPLASVVTDSAAEYGLVIQRLSPEERRLAVAIESADFADLVEWLLALRAEHAVGVFSAQLERRAEPGVVSANLVLER